MIGLQAPLLITLGAMVAVALLMFGAYTFGKKRAQKSYGNDDEINYVPLQGSIKNYA